MTDVAPSVDDAVLSCCMAGLAAQGSGRMNDAIAEFGRALALQPANLDIRLMLAFAQGASDARSDAHRTLAATPHLAELREADARRMADAATTLGADAVALTVVQRILSFTPTDPNLHSTLGALHHRLGDVASASTVLHRAHVRWPSHVPTLMNRARLLADTGEYAEALALYDEVLRHDDRHANARWYRGLLCLLLGQQGDGWRDHEARRELPVLQTITPPGLPAWDGSDPDGRTLLLWGEQGLGDQLMGARFATWLAARGARVIVRSAASVAPVIATVEGVDCVITPEDGTPPECDAHVPMLSVPHLCGAHDEDALDGRAYLRAPDGSSAAVEQWLRGLASRHDGKRRQRVALVWAGSATHGNDRNRSFPADELASLIGGADVDWISLQLGPRRGDLDTLAPALRARVADASSVIETFADTAHIVAACDMVVTVDTSVAHLAGAMGIPTIVMLPHVPDWRWQIARRDTPWYRSMRLIRQPMAGAWPHVIADVHRAVNSGSA